MSKTFKCENCGKTKTISDYRYNRSNHHYCSRSCYNEAIKNNTNIVSNDIKNLSNYEILKNKDLNFMVEFLSRITCRNYKLLPKYREYFKIWLTMLGRNETKLSDLFFDANSLI